MCKNCWQEALQAHLTSPHNRLAIVGIGHELRGDDAAGIEVIRRLQQLMPPQDDLLLVNGGSAPENVTGQIRRFAPDTILLIDALQLDTVAGDIQLIDWHDVSGKNSDTHSLSIRLVADYLTQSLNCNLLLLGIQPAHLNFDQALSKMVRESVNQIAHFLHNFIAPYA